MSRRESIGQFEQVVLTAILSLDENAYGVTIHATVKELSHPKQVQLGPIYVTLDRLEDKGYVTSWLSDPTPKRGGRAKRCYRLSAAGARALRDSAVTAKRVVERVTEAWGHSFGRFAWR